MHDFYPHAPEIKYVQNEEITCVFSSLSYNTFAANEQVSEHSMFQNFNHPYIVTQLVI